MNMAKEICELCFTSFEFSCLTGSGLLSCLCIDPVL